MGRTFTSMKAKLFFEVDEFVKKSIRDEFSIFLDLALLKIDLSSKSRLIKYAHLFVYAITHAVLLPVGIVQTIIIRTEFFYFTQSLYYVLHGILGAFITVMMIFHNEDLHEFHAYWAKGLYDYHEPQRPEIDELKKEIQRERKRLILFPVFVVVVGILLLVALFIDEWMGVYTRTYVNGVNVRLIVPLLVPFDTHEGIAYYAISALLLLEVGFTVLSIAGILLVYSIGSQRFLLQLRILRWSVRHVEERAEELHRSTKAANVDNTETFEQCLLICLKRNIDHYCRIKSYYDVFANLMSPVILCGFVVSTISISLSLVILIDKETLTLGNILSSASMGLSTVANIFVVCSYGERISTECELLVDDLYSISWHHKTYNTDMKKIFIIFKSLIRNPLIFKAGGFVGVNMPTYKSIITTAYSYFNLLNARKQREY